MKEEEKKKKEKIDTTGKYLNESKIRRRSRSSRRRNGEMEGKKAARPAPNLLTIWCTGSTHLSPPDSSTKVWTATPDVAKLQRQKQETWVEWGSRRWWWASEEHFGVPEQWWWCWCWWSILAQSQVDNNRVEEEEEEEEEPDEPDKTDGRHFFVLVESKRWQVKSSDCLRKRRRRWFRRICSSWRLGSKCNTQTDTKYNNKSKMK